MLDHADLINGSFTPALAKATGGHQALEIGLVPILKRWCEHTELNKYILQFILPCCFTLLVWLPESFHLTVCVSHYIGVGRLCSRLKAAL